MRWTAGATWAGGTLALMAIFLQAGYWGGNLLGAGLMFAPFGLLLWPVARALLVRATDLKARALLAHDEEIPLDHLPTGLRRLAERARTVRLLLSGEPDPLPSDAKTQAFEWARMVENAGPNEQGVLDDLGLSGRPMLRSLSRLGGSWLERIAERISGTAVTRDGLVAELGHFERSLAQYRPGAYR